MKFIGKEAVTPIRAKGNDVALKLTLEDFNGICGRSDRVSDGLRTQMTARCTDAAGRDPAGYHTLAVDAGPLHAEAALDLRTARTNCRQQ